MNAVTQNETEALNAAPIFFSQSIGVIFSDSDAIRNNSFLKQEIAKMPKEHITKKDGNTSFQVPTAQVGYFMHMMFANMPEGFILQSDWDGIYPFMGEDEQGNPALYNAQLVTIRQVAESFGAAVNTSHLH